MLTVHCFGYKDRDSMYLTAIQALVFIKPAFQVKQNIIIHWVH